MSHPGTLGDNRARLAEVVYCGGSGRRSEDEEPGPRGADRVGEVGGRVIADEATAPITGLVG